MKAVRFRCPKCRAIHSASPAKAGQVYACKACYGPLIVPGAPEGPSSEIPTLVAIPTVEAKVEVAEKAQPAGEPIETPLPKARPRPRVDRRQLIATAALVVAAGAVVGLVRQPYDREGRFRAANPRPELNVTPTPAPTPQPLPEMKPPTPPVEVVAVPEPPVVKVPRADDPNRPLVIRRRQNLGQEELRRQLAGLPEVAASDKTESALLALHQVIPPGRQGRSPASAVTAQERERLRRAAALEKARRRNLASQGATRDKDQDEDTDKPGGMHVARTESAPREMLAMIQGQQPELATLPWRMGDECHLGQEAAENLQVISRALRTLLAQSTPQGDTRPDADLLRAALLEEPREADAQENQAQAATPPPSTPPAQRRRRPASKTKFVTPAAIPALQQLLMAERTPVRLVLVDVLDKIQCREATKGLARLAMFDLAPEVRERALLVLRARPAQDYRASFVDGLRYPWAPVADHAAEALVALSDRDAVASLVALLDQPDPSRPRSEIRDGKTVVLATSLVQVNHLQNCVLCHAPSGDSTKDFVRGRVPDETQPLPPPIEYYANSSPGLFVRADVTYLRQEFSVTQPVDEPGPWPAFQRYDYLLTEKPVSRWTLDAGSSNRDAYPQRESVLFALRELTGKDLGGRSSDWKGEVQAGPPTE